MSNIILFIADIIFFVLFWPYEIASWFVPYPPKWVIMMAFIVEIMWIAGIVLAIIYC